MTESEFVELPPAIFRARASALPTLGNVASQVAIRERVSVGPEEMRATRYLFAFESFRCSGVVPNVRGLYLSPAAEVSEATARCFSGVSDLRLEQRGVVDARWFDQAPLRRLALQDTSLTEWTTLEGLPLKTMNVMWTGRAPLERLPKTVSRVIVTAFLPLPAKLLASLWTLPALESIRLVNIELKDFRALARSPRLADVSVQATSFEGIGDCQHLKRVAFARASCPMFGELSSSNTIRELEVRTRKPPADLQDLGKMKQLERLVLQFGDIRRPAEVSSLRFLKSLRNLRELEILGTKVIDRDISPIETLADLRVLRLNGDFGPEVSRLRGDGSGRVVIIDARPAAPADDSAGPVRVREMEGKQVVFQDVSSLLGTSDNHGAEKLIKAALQRTNPTVATRIDFDSEADMFCARADNAADIQCVADAILSLMP